MGADTLAVDLGGTHVRAARVDPSGRVHDRLVEPTATDRVGPTQVVDMLKHLADRSGVDTAVVGLPGRVDRYEQRLEYARNLPPAWVAELSAARLSEATGLDVRIGGDVELAVVGEAYFGAGSISKDTAYLTFSTGVGTAATSRGRLLTGRYVGLQIGFVEGLGEPGQMLDALGSGQALRRCEGWAAAPEGDVQQILARIDSGDLSAARAWAAVVDHARWAALLVCHVVAPEILVVGGGLTAAGPRLLEPIAAAVRDGGVPGRTREIAVVASRLAGDAALAGAAAWTLATSGLCRPEDPQYVTNEPWS